MWDHLVTFWLHLMVASISGKHAEKSELKDLLDQLMESEVFDGGLQNHKSFLNLKART